jgi:hypothetical protein
VGCIHTPFVCAQPSSCSVYECVGDDGTGHPSCEPKAAVVCDDGSSCTVDSCIQNFGCVYQNVSCSPTSDCNFPIGCIGTGDAPQCIEQNITSLFDFCGVCRGENTDCFFTTLASSGAVGGITGGAVAGVVVACVIAALIFAWLSKKGYEHYRAKGDMNATGATSNPCEIFFLFFCVSCFLTHFASLPKERTPRRDGVIRFQCV